MQKLDIKRTGKAVWEMTSQRKEENRKFYIDHLKALGHEQSITETTIDSACQNCTDGYLELIEKEYRFVKFNDISFGKDRAKGEEDLTRVTGVCFYYCSFSMCNFSNIYFEDCSFVGCDFIECYTLGIMAVFRNCSFNSHMHLSKSIEDMPSLFEGCELTVKLINCDVSSIVFDKAHFYFSNFDNVCMSDAIFRDCNFDTTQINGCDLRGTKIVNPKFIEFHVEDLDKKTKVNRKTFLDYISYNKKEEREVRYAVDVYDAFSELYENSKIMDFSGEYFFLSQKAGIENLEGLAKIKSIFSLITCGYGERPSYSLMASLFLIFVCGTLYMFFGVSSNNEVLIFNPSPASPFPPLDKMIIWYHFSLVTFSTVGYGNVVPVGGSYIVSAVEMVLGVIMVGIWVSTLVRKMTRN